MRIIPSTRASDMQHLVVMVISYIIHRVVMVIRRDCRYKRGNQNPHIEKEQTTQWPKEKEQTNDIQNIHIKLKIEVHELH